MHDWLPGLITAIVTLLGAYMVARLGSRATQAHTVVEKDLGAGELALKIATETRDENALLRRELTDLHRRVRDLRDSWFPWRSYVDFILTELMRIDPSAATRIPPRPPDMPFE